MTIKKQIIMNKATRNELIINVNYIKITDFCSLITN